jgi:glyoxylase I family protein
MKVNRIHHCSVLVSDTEVSVRFYEQVLGLEVDASRPDLGYPGAWLNVGDGQIHLLELPSPDPVQGRPEHVGRDRHMAFAMTGIDEVIQQLEVQNIPFTKSRSGRVAIFFRDPDGNGIELIEQIK